MNDEWVETRLSDVLQQVSRLEDVALLEEVPYAGVRWHAEGVYPRVVEDASKVKAKRLNRLQLHDVTYNRMWATKAAFGVVGGDSAGCLVTNDFPIFEAKEGLLPEYLSLVFATQRFQEAAAVLAVGTTERRRLKEADFLSIALSLPPLSVQRRIVDLLAHLDNHLANLQTERDAAESARLASLESRLCSVEGETTRLGDLLDIARGGSPRPIDDYFTDSPDGLNWIKIGDVPPEGRYITGTAQKIRPEGLSKTRQVKSGDFLLSNSMSFGRPYILRIDGCIHDGWLVLAGVERAFDPEYLYFLLRSNGVQDQFRSLAAGSGVKNLNIKVVNSVKVVVPTKEVQASVAADASAWMELIEDLDAEATSLREFRQFILSALLSGDLELPATYDSLLPEVA